jgi:cell division protein FtsI/penicillin-binding protein 2
MVGAQSRVSRRTGNKQDRINFLVAVVFLLALALALKVAYLQVIRGDYYTARAASMHKVNTKIEPERGKIYLSDRTKEDGLYPLATNKEYIAIFAVPKDLEDKKRVIDKVYEFFRADSIQKEVDKLLDKQDEESLMQALNQGGRPEAEIRAAHRQLLADYGYQEARKQKRQALIEAKKQEVYNDLEARLSRPNDPYELLEKKVDAELAKQFHLALMSDLWQNAGLDPDELKIENNKIYRTDNGALVPLVYAGIGYQSEYYRYYIDNELACHVLGYTDNEKTEENGVLTRHGRYGLEGFFDEELAGRQGEVQGERGAGGTLIVLDRQHEEKKNGDDLVMTIDRSMQFQAAGLVKKAVEAYSADSATIIVMEPKTGGILAMASYPGFDPNNYNQVKDGALLNNPAIFDAYEPGSVFKPITMAAAINDGKINPSSVYNDPGQMMVEGWPKPIGNSDFSSKGAHGTQNMTQVLEKSLNTGAIYAMRTIGKERFAEYVKAFGFGEKTGIELEGESKGSIANLTTKKIKEISAATASFGQGLSATPIQVITGFATLANGGKLVKPNIVKEIRKADGDVLTTPITEPRQVISPEAAAMVTSMLIRVVDDGKSYRTLKMPGYYIAGKTGTAQIYDQRAAAWSNLYNHTFVGYAPADDPKFVILVRVARPRGFEYAESTAVPIARQMNEFILKYWQVPENRR